MIIAIETATDICSVACRDEKGNLHERRERGRGAHSEKLFHFLEELKADGAWHPDGLTEVLISGGPGSYTGLRIGAAAVKGLLFSRDTPLYSLGTLLSLGAGVLATRPETGRLHLVLDARRKHLYHQLLETGPEEISADEPVIRPIREIEERWIRAGDSAAGTGLVRLDAGIRSQIHCYDDSWISARHLIHARTHPWFSRQFRQREPARFEPDYLSMGQLKPPSV